MNWNNDWRDELKISNYDCYARLCECRNTKQDIILMAKFLKRYNPTKTAEDCYVYMLEWITDWNNQWQIMDNLTTEEYKNAIAEIEKEM